jgi:ribonuclease HII
MERLMVWAQEQVHAPIDAVCGKVGGLTYYEDAFRLLRERAPLHAVLTESKARSAYRFPSFGDVAFVRDADADDGLVALASLVGKWVRDRFMQRVLAHHQQFTRETLPNASGYHDPVTQDFVSKTALTRKQRAFPEACFARKKAR